MEWQRGQAYGQHGSLRRAKHGVERQAEEHQPNNPPIGNSTRDTKAN